MGSLAGKVVIVTGASSGIGAATARALIAEACKVVLAARSTEKLERLADELGSDALALTVNVTVGAEVEHLVKRTLSHFGKIDALLANAGVYLQGEVHEGDPDAWAKLVDVNVNGVLRSIRAVLPVMMAQRSGDIIITSSISGFEDIVWEPVYSASKHAVQGLTHTCAAKLRRRVSALARLHPAGLPTSFGGLLKPPR